jgi:hypothetical protein
MLPQKLIIPQLVKKNFYGTRELISVITSVHQWIVTQARPVLAMGVCREREGGLGQARHLFPSLDICKKTNVKRE